MRAFSPERILLIGMGAVGHVVLRLVERHLHVPCSCLTVVDFEDRTKLLQPWIARGLHFIRERITPTNMVRLLSSHVRSGGLIVDLAWSVDCLDILDWAGKNNVLYVNASLESWDYTASSLHKPSIEKSLYARYVRLLKLIEERRYSTTAVVDHGANPGLISHFVKQGLLDIAEYVLQECPLSAVRRRKIERLREEEAFAELAYALDVRAIHCSEWDRQRTDTPRQPNEFVNTWGVQCMWEEAVSPSELGWGTHEKNRPPYAIIPNFGPGNQIILPQMGMNTWVRSWVPNHEIVAMVVTHGEAFTISHALTVRRRGRVVYRPTVHYAYMPSEQTMASLHELRCRHYELQPICRVLTDEITAGEDLVGALMMGPLFKSWWTGSVLSIEEARKKVPHSNATAVQIAAGILAAILWALRNPNRGICLPENLPHRDILSTSKPYLGQVVSTRSDWTPLQQHQVYFPENKAEPLDEEDPWQFTNFLFRP